jgi:hypothetical protein
MKNSRKLGILLIAVSAAVVLVGCRGPAGPQGPEGPAGDPVVDTVLSAYLSSRQPVPSSTSTRIEFNTTDVDVYDGLDTTTDVGVYNVQESGNYHVAVGVDWRDIFTSGTDIDYRLLVNGPPLTSLESTVAGDTAYGTFSRSITDLAVGDTLSVEVWHDEGAEIEVWSGDGEETYITIDRLD